MLELYYVNCKFYLYIYNIAHFVGVLYNYQLMHEQE